MNLMDSSLDKGRISGFQDISIETCQNEMQRKKNIQDFSEAFYSSMLFIPKFDFHGSSNSCCTPPLSSGTQNPRSISIVYLRFFKAPNPMNSPEYPYWTMCMLAITSPSTSSGNKCPDQLVKAKIKITGSFMGNPSGCITFMHRRVQYFE